MKRPIINKYPMRGGSRHIWTFLAATGAIPAAGVRAAPKYFDTGAASGLQAATGKLDLATTNWATDSLGTGFGSTLLAAGDDVFFQAAAGSSYTLASSTPPSLNSLSVDNANSVDFANTASSTVLAFGSGNMGITVRGASTLTIDTVNTSSTFVSGSPAILVRDGSTFIVDNTATGGAKTVALGAVSFGPGENTFRLQRATAFNLTVTAASLAARPAGSAADFVIDPGAQTRKLTFTTSPGTGFIDQGSFYNGSNFAAYDATNGVRALNYSTDGGATLTTASTTFSAAAATGKHVDLGTTGSIAAAGNESINTLRLGGTNGVTIADGNTLTFASGGVLKTGGGSASITGGAGITAGGKEFVFRADTAADTLLVSTPILSTSTGGVTKAGQGVVVLSGANSYTGPTTINGGVLRVGPAGLGAGNVSLSGGVLETSTSLTARSLGAADGQVQITGGVSGFSASGGPVTVDLSGTSAGSGSVVTWGAAAFNPATLILSESTASGAINFANSIDLNGATRAVAVNSASNAATISGPIIGTGGLTKTGVGVLILSGVNTYDGGTTVTAGLLQVASTTAIPATGKITVSVGGAVAVTGAYTDVTGWLGSGKLAASSVGALAFTGPVSGEAIDLTANKSLSIGSALGNAVTYTGTITPGASGYFLGGGGGTITLPNASALTGANNLGVGNGGGGTVVIAAANDFTGGTTVNAGILQAAHANALGSGAGGLTVTAAGTLDLRGNDIHVGSLAGAAGGVITDTSAVPGTTTVTDVIASGSSTFTGGLKDGPARTLALVKDGAGTLVLNNATAANTLTRVALNNGRLDVRTNNAGVLPAATTFTFTGNATLALANNSANAVALFYGPLNLTTGEATIESNNYGGKAAGAQTLTFPALPARPTGTALNFTLGNVTAGTAATPSTYQVAFTAAPAGSRSIDGGVFYSGYTPATPDFATYDSAGYIRGLSYTSDAGAIDVNAASPQASLGTVTGLDVQLRGGGGVAAQTSDTVRTLKIADGTRLALADANQVLTVSSAGILKTGGGTATISGGSVIGSATDLSVRTAAATDTLVITSAILNNAGGTGSGLTKSGAGRLVLASNNTYTGATAVLAGTLEVDGKIGGPVTLTGGTLAGSGTIQLPATGPGAAGVVVSAAATLALSATGGAPLTIAAAGSNPAVAFSPGSTLAVSLSHAGTSAPALQLSGSIDLTHATLALAVDAAVQPGDIFTLIHDTTDTPFGVSTLPGGGGTDATSGGWSYHLSTQGQDVLLTIDSVAVPEPSAITALVLAGLPRLTGRRRRRPAGAR